MTLPLLGWALHVAGGMLVFYLARRDLARRRLATEGMTLVTAAALVGGLLGALLLNFPGWLGSHWQEWSALPFAEKLQALMVSGRTWIGGLLGGYALVAWTKARLGIRRSTGDSFAVALPLGEAVGRLGCLAYGCCYGSAGSLPWSIWQHGAWRHPTQLYAAGMALLLWLVLRAARDRLPSEGDLFKLYLAGYAVCRFTLEVFRDHQGVPGISAAQWACVAGLGLLAVFWLPRFVGLARKRASYTAAAAPVPRT